MDSIKKARHRLSLYPQFLRSCGKTAALYAKCVVEKESKVSKYECDKEFQQFKSCMAEAAKSMKVKL